MSAARTAPATTPSPAPRPRRWLRASLVVLAALLFTAVALSIAANAAASAVGAHTHGSLDIIIAGQTVDLDQPRFHDLHPHFHVHAGHGNRWHHHPQNITGILGFEPMTLDDALAAVGADVAGKSLTFDGAVFDASDPQVRVTVRVDGTEVDPATHVVGDGDAVTVEVTTRQ